MIAQLVKVALDMTGGQTRGAIGEQRINRVPRQQGSVEAAGHRVFISILIERLRNTGDNPRLRLYDADSVLGILKVVNIRGIVLRAAGCSCYQMRKLSREGYPRRLGAMQEGQLVYHTGEPLTLCLPVDVQAPQRVLQRF